MDDELRAWEKKALNSNPVKASGFVAVHTPAEIQAMLRDTLKAMGKTAPREAIKALFRETRDRLKKNSNAGVIKPPADLFDYWKDYDGLMTELGDAWLSDYMSKVDIPVGDVPPGVNDIQAALDQHHDAFQEALLGTEEEPGILVKLVLAGMVAGNQAITHNSAANPQKPSAKKDDNNLSLAVDWNLLNREARDFAKQYFYTLIRNVDDTTRLAVQKAVTAWIESGEPMSALQAKLTEIFHDATRAQLIAQTESTRAYAAGSTERYRRADVKKVTWNTVKMPVGDSPGDVCPLCDELEKKGPTPIEEMPVPPRHPGCRCWLRPVVIGEEL